MRDRPYFSSIPEPSQEDKDSMHNAAAFYKPNEDGIASARFYAAYLVSQILYTSDRPLSFQELEESVPMQAKLLHILLRKLQVFALIEEAPGHELRYRWQKQSWNYRFQGAVEKYLQEVRDDEACRLPVEPK